MASVTSSETQLPEYIDPDYKKLAVGSSQDTVSAPSRTLEFISKSLGGKFVLRDSATAQVVYFGKMPMFKRHRPDVELRAGADKASPIVAVLKTHAFSEQQMGLGDPALPQSVVWEGLRTVSTWDMRVTFDADVGGQRRQYVWERGPYHPTADGRAGTWAGMPCSLRYSLVDRSTGQTVATSAILDKWSWTRAGALTFAAGADGPRELELWAIMSWINTMVWVSAVPSVLQAETAAAGLAAHKEKKELKAEAKAQTKTEERRPKGHLGGYGGNAVGGPLG